MNALLANKGLRQKMPSDVDFETADSFARYEKAGIEY